jgi:hypothetical protein
VRVVVAGLRRDALYDLLVPPFILATPFVSFVNHNEYGYAAAEVWISFTGLAAAGLLCGLIIVLGGQWLRVLVTAGLLTLFVDLQFEWLDPPTYFRCLCLGSGMLLLCWLLGEHLSRIIAPVFATMLAAGLLFPGGSAEWSAKASAPPVDAQAMARPAPPVIVHLIFDAFIGVEGIPPEVPHGTAVARSLRSFLHDAGFHVFGRAYSRFDRTENSIPNMLNYASVPEQRHFIKDDHRRLRENQYFSDMRKRGYAIHVYQPDYMDFCGGHEREISSCRTFPTFGIAALHTLELPVLTKTELVLRNFVELSMVWRILKRKVTSNDHYFPKWLFTSPDLWPVRSFQLLDIVAHDVANASPGDFYFAHLLVPHDPYVYDRHCNLRDPHDWEDLPWSTNAESRIHYYTLYVEQLECLRTRLQGIFGWWSREGVFDHSRIIIHGDHGSRLYRREATIANGDELLISDYVDSFSALFAVKAPGLDAEYDRSMVAIQDALAAVAHDQPLDQLSAQAASPYVLLPNRGGSAMMRRPMPDFGDLPAQ